MTDLFRRKAAVLRTTGVVQMPRTKHFVGLPPSLSGLESQQLLPLANVLIIEQATEGRDMGFFLFRYTREGELVGDTWHLTQEDALEQAKYEYGLSIDKWSDLPNDVTDPVAFVLAKCRG